MRSNLEKDELLRSFDDRRVIRLRKKAQEFSPADNLAT